MSAVIAVKRKRLVRRFYEAGATDQDHAVALESLGERRSWIFDQMLHHGVFSDIPDGRFFMDVELADQFLPPVPLSRAFDCGISVAAVWRSVAGGSAGRVNGRVTSNSVPSPPAF